MEEQQFGNGQQINGPQNGGMNHSGTMQAGAGGMPNAAGMRGPGNGAFGGRRGFERNPYINHGAVVPGSARHNPYLHQGAPVGDALRQNPYYQDQPLLRQNPGVTDSLFGAFDTENFMKGALLGALGAYLLTNETAQKAIFKTVARGTQMFQAGMEEMKERYEDAKAELEAEQ